MEYNKIHLTQVLWINQQCLTAVINNNTFPTQTFQIINQTQTIPTTWVPLSRNHPRLQALNKTIEQSNAPPIMQYEPNHPYANKSGFVAYPNINKVDEMTNMMRATRAYEADVRVINSTQNMTLHALEIGDKGWK